MQFQYICLKFKTMSLKDISTELLLYLMLYSGAAAAAFIASIYLLLRKGNAFADGITPPVRLRRWAAAFFAVVFLGHIWWLLFYLYSGDIDSVGCMVISYLDCVALMTTIPGTLFAMFQDRKRHIWPIVIATIPFLVFEFFHIVKPYYHFFNIAIVYFLLLYVIFTIYIVFAVKQYGRWLRYNYADLENKEVWLSHVLIIVILVLIITYGFGGNSFAIGYFIQVAELILFGLLLWRVETLPQLESTPIEQQEQTEPQAQQSVNIPSNIEQLLDEHCVATKLYLQHDLTLIQLAQAIGTNRFYLSQYFSRHGITYNAYINNLRINHFVNLYREAAATHKPITAQQLASDSGYHSYSTFSLAFKQRMGQSVTAWMRDTAD